MKHSLLLIMLMLALIVFLFVLSTRSKPPLLPRDPQHTGLKEISSCTHCHAPGKQSPLKPAHPPKEQCMICHT